MNRSRIFLIFLGFMIFQSCEKDPDWRLWDYEGSVTATLNGSPWQDALVIGFDHRQDTVTFANDPGISFTIDKYNQNGLLRQKIVFGQIPCELGRYNLKTESRNNHNEPYASFITLQDDGDVVGDRFAVYDTDNSYIEILTLDDNYVSADFQLFLKRNLSQDSLVYSSLPDTLLFTNGKLTTTLTAR
ncbi:MAG: hypothetical protein KJP00_07850 [Bacteroidia bacterium]|nr:hypothetical protein [Bacteroidia bacterium]